MPKYLLFSIALFWTGLVSYLCLVDSNEIPTINIPNLDKCIHTIFHLVFTVVWFLFIYKQLQSSTIHKPLVFSVLLSFVFGIAIEVMQNILTETRNADVLDVIANTVGAILAAIIISFFSKSNILYWILKK